MCVVGKEGQISLVAELLARVEGAAVCTRERWDDKVQLVSLLDTSLMSYARNCCLRSHATEGTSNRETAALRISSISLLRRVVASFLAHEPPTPPHSKSAKTEGFEKSARSGSACLCAPTIYCCSSQCSCCDGFATSTPRGVAIVGANARQARNKRVHC